MENVFFQKREPFCGVPCDGPKIMGIVNVTPDSFSDGGLYYQREQAIAHGIKLFEDGADFLDIGGESTRPGAEEVSEEEEMARVLPVIEGLLTRVSCPLSIDTRKAAVMEKAIALGVHLVNDVSGLTFDSRSVEVISRSQASVILMHAQGKPKNMQENPHYSDASSEVFDFLQERLLFCQKAGIPRARLAIDPGIGFGKTFEHNINILVSLARYQSLGTWVALGLSRKSFLGTITGEKTPEERDIASISGALWAVCQGVQLLRVHDVRKTRDAFSVWNTFQNYKNFRL